MRFGWLKKGFDALESSGPTFFGHDDAMVVLGVGKNMVRAIRHWGLACQVWEEVDGSRGRELQPTGLGSKLLADGGWDPYLEDIASIWLLHWLVVTNGERATTWTVTFSRPSANRFTKDELLVEVRDLIRDEQSSRVADATIKRDIAVMLRGYCRPASGRNGFGEDAIDTPFALLNLVRSAGERGVYEVVQGPHPALPTRIFEAALVEYLTKHREPPARAATFDELLYAPLSPGRTFRLSEEGLLARLAHLVELDGARYAFDETAGLRQLLVVGEAPSRDEVLETYYRPRTLEEAA